MTNNDELLILTQDDLGKLMADYIAPKLRKKFIKKAVAIDLNDDEAAKADFIFTHEAFAALMATYLAAVVHGDFATLVMLMNKAPEESFDDSEFMKLMDKQCCIRETMQRVNAIGPKGLH
jgi:hypothetical protein